MLYQNMGDFILVSAQMDVDEFRKKNPTAVVEPTNEAWTKVLTDPANALQNQNAWLQLAQLGKGQVIDLPYQKPLRFVPQPDGSVMVVSNGKDGLPDTADDRTSEAALANLAKGK